MRYYPAFLDLQGKLCVVVGGGRVGERKVKSLLRAGAIVKVVGPELTMILSRLKERGMIRHAARSFRKTDLEGAFLGIAATDDREANRRVFAEACRRRIPVNVVDDPLHSSFIVPSMVARGDLLVAISTGGQSPALAKVLRQKLQREIGPEYADLLRLLGAVRRKILPRGYSQRRNQSIFRKLAGEDVLALVRSKDRLPLDQRLRALLKLSLKDLGFP